MRARAFELLSLDARRYAPRCVLVLACLAGTVISIHAPTETPAALAVILAGVFWYLFKS